jgi:site-specific DNA-methyltransferase (adenine-specific)
MTKSDQMPLTEIPALARQAGSATTLFQKQAAFPTKHTLYLGDARQMAELEKESVHLIVTSPPYWTLKKYNLVPGQLGLIREYESFLLELEKVIKECFRVLIPGGRFVCVVGDVSLARRAVGRHVVYPLHADITLKCREAGFDNLSPILWYKIANARYEANTKSTILGKPYEPNAVIKNDTEFILIQRKPGPYRKPTSEQRRLSYIPREFYEKWFRQIWDIRGESTRRHPAPYPLELAERLVRMYSFIGDTILDPMNGTGTTMVAAARCGRDSFGYEVDPAYVKLAKERFRSESETLFSRRYEVKVAKSYLGELDDSVLH